MGLGDIKGFFATLGKAAATPVTRPAELLDHAIAGEIVKKVDLAIGTSKESIQKDFPALSKAIIDGKAKVEIVHTVNIAGKLSFQMTHTFDINVS